jgi:hypothetical protein
MNQESSMFEMSKTRLARGASFTQLLVLLAVC